MQVPVTADARISSRRSIASSSRRDTLQHQQLYTVPVTQYQLVSRLHGRWNPFITPYWTHHYEPVTTWQQQTATVQIPVSTVAWAPETRTVQVPTTTYRSVEAIAKVPIGVASGCGLAANDGIDDRRGDDRSLGHACGAVRRNHRERAVDDNLGSAHGRNGPHGSDLLRAGDVQRSAPSGPGLARGVPGQPLSVSPPSDGSSPPRRANARFEEAVRPGKWPISAVFLTSVWPGDDILKLGQKGRNTAHDAEGSPRLVAQ